MTENSECTGSLLNQNKGKNRGHCAHLEFDKCTVFQSIYIKQDVVCLRELFLKDC